jgi:hypothetical protein
MRRMTCAQTAKKCARSCHDAPLPPASRMNASLTSAVGCSVCPGFSCRICCEAMRRSSA